MKKITVYITQIVKNKKNQSISSNTILRNKVHGTHIIYFIFSKPSSENIQYIPTPIKNIIVIGKIKIPTIT